MKYWGIHTVLDLSNCTPEPIRNPEVIKQWVKDLVVLLDMEAYGEPLIERFGKEDKAGYTCVQLIQTSNICAHFAEDSNSVFIDVFSCKEYDPIVVEDHCLSVFGGRINQCNVMYRR